MAETAKRYNSILDIIDKRLIPDVEAKGKRGEVFTPLNLVREMLFGIKKSSVKEFKNKVPDAKSEEYLKFVWGLDDKGEFIEEDEKDKVGGIPLSIWRDPDTKWLDPANGIGNFPVVAFYMLDYQLGKHGPKEFKGDDNKIKRRRHIVKNMLYMIELNKGNVNTSRKIFEKIVPGVTPNILCANTIEMTDDKLKKEFGVNKFDVVMGNPPYNAGGTGTSGEKRIWTKFIQFGFNLLNNKGCLIFVHPPNFHRINDDNPKKGIIVKQLFNENNLLFIRIIDNTKIYFDVQIGIDYYILQKCSNKKEAVILDKHNIISDNIDISIFNTVPNFGFNIIKKLRSLRIKHGEFKAQVGTDSTSHAARHDLYKNGTFPIIHLINNDGMRILMAINPHKYQSIPKILINGLGVPYVFDDSSGKYGVSEAPLYILEPSKKEKIFLFSKLFQYLIWAYRLIGNHNSILLFDIMPDLNKLEYNDEEGMLKKLGVNSDDELEINKYNVPKFPHVEKIEKAGEGKAPRAKKTEKKGGSRKSHRFTRRKSRN
jgi:hypothetical protein